MIEYDNETLFEKDFVELLEEDKGWRDGVLIHPTEEDLVNNWADFLYQRKCEIDKLGPYPLTKGEIAQLIDQINSATTPLQKNELILGGELQIVRDVPQMAGKLVTLFIFDRNEIAMARSRYQIARQVHFNIDDPILHERRGDVTLLINGLPLIHIELKSSKNGVYKAQTQIQGYSDRGIFSRGLMSLVQVFVAMNPEDMRYWANPGFGVKFNPKYMFKWTNVDNQPITHWRAVAENLLSIPKAHELIGYYTVADKGDNQLKVLRPYQYHAAESIANKVRAVNSLGWEGNNIYGGFIEHTTGSGKTLTSFKAAQMIAKRGLADKVVFLVDRIELGEQSHEEYENFTDSTLNVLETKNSSALVKKLKSPDEDGEILIVTSIQKMYRIDTEYCKQEDIDKINTKHIVIIVDECHRSTFGDMLVKIKHTLRHAIFFGFSGTPIRDENSHYGMTTTDIFGKRLHLYSIRDGITDENVLGFDPYMEETYSQSDVRRQIALDKANAADESEVMADEKKKKIYQKYMNKVPMAGYMDSKGKYHKGIEDFFHPVNYDNDKHRGKVVEHIKKKWMANSLGGMFHAILATSSIAEAVDYYRLMKEKLPQLKITCLFDPVTIGSDNDEDGTGRKLTSKEKEDALAEIYRDYKGNFGIEYKLSEHASFKKDLAQRLAHKKPYLNVAPEQQLNILIVVWQMLTGYDSKWVNALYLDKLLWNEHLIQAFSRTNRLNGIDKQHGIICYYRYPHSMKRNVDAAFKLYSGEQPAKLFVLKLPKNLIKMNETFQEIDELFASHGIVNFEILPDDEASIAKFAELFQKFNKLLYAARLQGFTWDEQHQVVPEENFEIDMLCDEETYDILLQRYHELALGGGGGGNDAVPYNLDAQLSEMATGKINKDYMNANFTRYVRAIQANAPTEEQQQLLNSLHKSFATLSQEDQSFARMFLTDFEHGNVILEDGKTFNDYLVEYRKRTSDKRIKLFADALGLDEQLLVQVMKRVENESDLTTTILKPIKDSMNLERAKSWFEKHKGRTISNREAFMMADDIIRKFILKGGFDIMQTNKANFADVHIEETNNFAFAAESFETHKRDNIDQRIIDVFSDNSNILVGCYKNKLHLEWIKKHGLYNIRLGKRRGSVDEDRELFEGTTHLVLYNPRKLNDLTVYDITGGREMTGEELAAIGYPTKKPQGKQYMTFIITPTERDVRLLTNMQLIEKLKENMKRDKNNPAFLVP